MQANTRMCMHAQHHHNLQNLVVATQHNTCYTMLTRSNTRKAKLAEARKLLVRASKTLSESRFEPLRSLLNLILELLELSAAPAAASSDDDSASTSTSDQHDPELIKAMRQDVDAAKDQLAQPAAAHEQAAAERAALLQQLNDLKCEAGALSRPGPGPSSTGRAQEQCRLDALQQQLSALTDSKPTTVPTKVVLRNVPDKYDADGALQLLSQCEVRSTDKFQCETLPTRKAGGHGTSFVLQFPDDVRDDVLAAAKQLKLREGIVVVPFLTPYGAALRRQRQPIYKQLLDQGCHPSWRGGANIRYTDNNGKSVLYDFGASPAA